jgi:hypothetical protein
MELWASIPLRWIPLLLHLCENTFCLVIDAVSASRHLSIALNLLFPAHIASLECRQHANCAVNAASPTLAILRLFASILSSIRDPSPKMGCDKSGRSMFGNPSA